MDQPGGGEVVPAHHRGVAQAKPGARIRAQRDGRRVGLDLADEVGAGRQGDLQVAGIDLHVETADGGVMQEQVRGSDRVALHRERRGVDPGQVQGRIAGVQVDGERVRHTGAQRDVPAGATARPERDDDRLVGRPDLQEGRGLVERRLRVGRSRDAHPPGGARHR